MNSSRRIARELAFKLLYQRVHIGIKRTGEKLLHQHSNLSKDSLEFCNQIVEHAWEKRVLIDELISNNLVRWKQSRLTESLNALLRTATAELLFTNTEGKIIINETLEICKEFVNTNSVKFCNGILNSIWKDIALIKKANQI